ncbi:MAG: S8 family peptidase [Pseudomonadota bacterium]
MNNATTTDFSTRQSSTAMDPRLQRAATFQRRGFLLEATASSAPSEIPVIAKVTSFANWSALSEVRGPMQIAAAHGKEKTSIVTGRIPLQRIEYVRKKSFVKSLKAAQPMQPTLAAGITETQAAPTQLPAGTLAAGGEGVVLGIIDYGCDYAHRNFRDGSGKTRLKAIWHQRGSLDPLGHMAYGREYTPAEINAALAQADPYSALGYAPPPDTMFSVGTHGTHVMDIAAGNGNGSGIAGFAPNAELIFVDVAHSDIAFSGRDVVDSSFGDSVMLLEAVQYIFDKAGEQPCVINISLGTNGGPHDGSTLVEQGIDRLVMNRPNRAVVVSASNSHEDGIHASGTLTQNGNLDLVWNVPTNDFSHNEMEIWYPAGDIFDVEMISPGGDSIGIVPAGSSGESLDASGAVQIFAANRISDPNNGDNMIGIFLEDTVAPGDWTIRLHGRTVNDGSFHAWIERDNQQPSSFAPPHDNTHTIGSISCGEYSIVVGSYDAHKSQTPISYFSSEGPTRDGREKPEISAPGHAVRAAHSRTGTEVVSKSGTSMASPAVAGIVALMLAESRARGIKLSIKDIRAILQASHKSRPPKAGTWNSRYGIGRINAAAVIAAVQDKAASATSSRSTRQTKRE